MNQSMENRNRTINYLIQILFRVAGLAIAVTIITISLLQDYEGLSIVKSLIVNLFAAHIILLAIKVMNESIVEDVTKAIILTLIMLPFWFMTFEYMDYIRCLSLSIPLGAWYLIPLKLLSSSGNDSNNNFMN